MEQRLNSNQEKKQITKDALLNIVSNILFLGCLWLMTMIVPIISEQGFEAAGVFTLALSVANIATAVATYNIESFFASDVENKFKDNHYFYFGMTSTLTSLVVSVIVCLIYGYSGEIFGAIILYNVFKMFDNYSFITRIIYQRHGCLSTFSILLIIRALLSIGLFAASMLLFKSLLIAMLALAVFGALYFACELFVLNKKCPGFFVFNKDVYKISLSIFYHALPVFIYGLCFAAIVTIPRLLFDNIFQDTSLLGYFGTMAAITSLIQAVTSALMLPFIPKITKCYLDKDKIGLNKYIILLGAMIVGLTALAFLMVVLLGNWALSLVYGEDILSYSSVFKWLVLSTGIQSLVIVFSHTMVSLRKFKHLLIGSISGAIIMLSTMYVLISNYSTYGVVYTYLISYGSTLIILLISFILIVKSIKKKEDDNVINQE